MGQVEMQRRDRNRAIGHGGKIGVAFERLLAGEVAPVFTTPAYPETEFSGSIVGPPR